MKLFKATCYALALLFCPALFCSAPAKTPDPIMDEEVKKMVTLETELQKGSLAMIEKSDNMEKACFSRASIEQSQAEVEAQKQRFENYKAQYLVSQKTGKLPPKKDQEIQRFIKAYTTILKETSHQISYLDQSRARHTAAKAELIKAGNQLSAQTAKTKKDADLCANMYNMILHNGSCTPLAATVAQICTLTLAERATELEKKHALFKSNAQSFLNEPKSSELQGNDSQQTQNK